MFGFSRLGKRLRTLVLLALTGGVGMSGYANRDHPIMQQMLGYVREMVSKEPAAPGEPRSGKAVLDSVVERIGPFHKPGEFEVTIEKITLDDKEFHAGHAIDLEVRVIKYDSQGGKGVVVWDGKNEAGRSLVAGRGPVTTDWADRPFKVHWKAGDGFDVEIWDRKGFRPSKKFVLETEEDHEFPLRTKTHILASMNDDKAVRDRSVNTITLKARRVGVKSTDTVAERDHGRVGTRR